MRKGIALFGFLAAAGLTVAFVAAPAQDKPKDKPKVEIEVPFVPTPPKVVDAMLRLAQVKEGDVVYDLGCGDGRIAIAAVRDFKAKKGLGIDFDPDRLKDCEANLKKLPPDQQKKLEFKQGDVLTMKPEEFKDVDVVTLYLLPRVNDRLQPTLKKGLKAGSRVVSHAFGMEGWTPDKTEHIKDDDGLDRTIYLWTIKKQ
jgi:SAM-dependent methyltransferase